MPVHSGNSMPAFRSILYALPESVPDNKNTPEPEIFSDLNLDQIVTSITAGYEGYNLKPYFYVPLLQVESVNYRHEIFRELENKSLFDQIGEFGEKMRSMRALLVNAEELRHRYQKRRLFLEAVAIYCNAVTSLTQDLLGANLRSNGFLAFREYLSTYVESCKFTLICRETKKLQLELAGITYSLFIEGPRIKVRPYGSEPDYSAEVMQTFEKFKQREASEYKFEFSAALEVNSVESAILDLVAQVYSETFSSLDNHCEVHKDYLDYTIRNFDREVHFYVTVLGHVERMHRARLPMCYPEITSQSKSIFGIEIFDLALADKFVRENKPLVTNEFHLNDPERIIVVSGPNQGGKTTFARTFGQIHYLASLGCPVPGSKARLFLCDRLFTHFEREEDLGNLSGKLEEELLRIRRILEGSTANSILVMNESFASTTLGDALFLNKHLMRQVIDRDMLCIFVTFLDELASLSEQTVSMVSTIDPKESARRTFKIVRRAADGRAYALAIAEKYGLTYGNVKERMAR